MPDPSLRRDGGKPASMYPHIFQGNVGAILYGCPFVSATQKTLSDQGEFFVEFTTTCGVLVSPQVSFVSATQKTLSDQC
jgi:hypothetical protein